MLNDAKNLGSSLAFCEAAKCIGQRKSSLKMCTSLHQERVRRLQTATLRQPVHNTALYVKTEFSMRTEQKESNSSHYSFNKYALRTYIPCQLLF